jgi:hypothetical protein
MGFPYPSILLPLRVSGNETEDGLFFPIDIFELYKFRGIVNKIFILLCGKGCGAGKGLRVIMSS